MTMERGGSEIQFKTDADGEAANAISAYLARPPSGRGRGVLVIHENWGLTDATREVCDRLARAGFVALAPDLFRGSNATDRAAAQRLAQELDIDRAAADLDAAVRELFNQNATDGPSVGALGLCIGGPLALLVGSRNRRIGAVVSFYGANSAIETDFESLDAPVLAIFAGDDDSIAEPTVRSLEADLKRADVRASVQIRAGVQHGYMDDTRPDVFDAVAASEGWDALVAFFRAELA
jgi:carboxymethylenebutenolidase